jgi:predicted dehydrogenase
MEKINLGFIGLGHVGQIAHFKNYLYNPKVYISGICDSRLDLVENIGKRYGITNTTNDAKSLIDDPGIDAIVIVVDRGAVFSLCHDSLIAKKHVLTEKPMALNSVDANKLVDIANKNNLVYKVGFMRKYDLGIDFFLNKVKGLLADQTLGRMCLLRIHAFDSHSSYAGGHDSALSDVPKLNSDPLTQVPKLIPPDRSYDYLNTLNVYSHHLNILNSIFDESYDFNLQYVNFKNRHCRLVNLSVKSETHFATEVILELGSIPAIVHDEYIEASFEGGTIRVDFPPNMLKDASAKVTLNTYGSESQKIEQHNFPYSWSFRNQAFAFIDDVANLRLNCINSGKTCLRDMLVHDKLWALELERAKND